MIDFRYHLVSLMAVFLALALGVVVGTTALNGPVLDDLRGRISGLTDEKRALEADVRSLRDQVSDDDAFTQAVLPRLVDGALVGESVTVLLAPGAPEALVQPLQQALEAAGAEVVSRVSVRPALLDPGRAALLDDVVTAVAPAGVQLPDGEAVDRAAVVLAAALLTAPGDALPQAEATRVLAGLEEAGFVEHEEVGDGGLADLAVLLTSAGPGVADEQAERRQRGLLQIARATDERGRGTVVSAAGNAVSTAGVLDAVRSDDGLSEVVSTVDSADRPFGRVLVVRALAEQRLGRAGAYGAGDGAVAVVPTAGPR